MNGNFGMGVNVFPWLGKLLETSVCLGKADLQSISATSLLPFFGVDLLYLVNLVLGELI